MDTAYDIVRQPTLTNNDIITNHLRAPYGVFTYQRIVRFYGARSAAGTIVRLQVILRHSMVIGNVYVQLKVAQCPYGVL